MAKRIKTIEKPEWFDLNKYSSLAELSANDWAYQLHHRAYLMECFASVLNNWDKKSQEWISVIDSHNIATEKWSKSDESLFKRIINTPLLVKGGDFVPDARKVFFSKSGSNHQSLFQNHVVPLTSDRVYQLFFALPNELKLAFKSDEIISHDMLNIPVDSVDCKSEGVKSGNVNLTIDLNAYDDELIKNFKAYLKSARELYEFPEGNEITKGMLKRLNNLKILPYLDLLLWAKQSRVYISRETMGNWLFPNDEINIVEKIKKGTIPLAIKCLSYNFINVLASLETTEHFSD